MREGGNHGFGAKIVIGGMHYFELREGRRMNLNEVEQKKWAAAKKNTLKVWNLKAEGMGAINAKN